MSQDGFNPIKHDCCGGEKCFMKTKHFSIELLAKFLPGKIAFTDIDGFTEWKRHFLLLEFKGGGRDLPTGQAMGFARLTEACPKALFCYVDCDYETSEISRMRIIIDGKRVFDSSMDFDSFGEFVSWWAESPAEAMAKLRKDHLKVI